MIGPSPSGTARPRAPFSLLASLWLGSAVFLPAAWFVGGFGPHFWLIAAGLAAVAALSHGLVRWLWPALVGPGSVGRRVLARLFGYGFAFLVAFANMAAFPLALAAAERLGLGRPEALAADVVSGAGSTAFSAALEAARTGSPAGDLAAAPLRGGTAASASLMAAAAVIVVPLAVCGLLCVVSIFMGVGDGLRRRLPPL